MTTDQSALPPGSLASSPGTGRDILEAIRDGELGPPPIARLLDLELVDVGTGHTAFRFVPAESHHIRDGVVAGGALAAIMDLATGTAIMTQLPAGAVVATTNLAVTFIRAARTDAAPFLCDAHLIHAGRTTAHAEATITNAARELVARAAATCRLPANPPTGTG
jgi:uncharacterized protein (TIGR00369 family)